MSKGVNKKFKEFMEECIESLKVGKEKFIELCVKYGDVKEKKVIDTLEGRIELTPAMADVFETFTGIPKAYLLEIAKEGRKGNRSKGEKDDYKRQN
jgi:hypothetical protein